MGIRRRRKKVNTILTTIDRRLKSVELQRVPRVVKDGTITKKMLSKEVKISLETSGDASTNKPGTSTPATEKPPTFRTNPYTNIVKIIYRGYNEVGTANDRDRARVYFETDPGFNVDDKIKFASLTGSLDVPTKTVEYTVKEVAVVDGYHTIVYYPGRATIVNGPKTYDKGWRVKASNVSVTGAIVDGATTTYKYGQVVLDLKDTLPSTDDDYKWGPTWPAGIDTTSGLHFTGGGFEVGDLINFDGLGTLFDGTHKITFREKVGYKLTIQFEFSTYPTAPVTLPNSSGAVRGACGRFLRDGETWTDTSVEPAITWIWDEQRQRWWNAAEGAKLPEGVVIDDGIPPSPPTNLSGTSEGYMVGDKAYSKVALSWTAPTTNSDGTNLSDLKGYAVYYRYTAQEEWTFSADTATTSYTVPQLEPRKNILFSVKAYDLTRNMSTYSDSLTVLSVAGSNTLNAPSKPVSNSRLGQIKITWDGLDSTGATPPEDKIDYIEVHWSTTSGFTPSAATNKGRLLGKNDFFTDIDPAYNTNYYFKFIFIDKFKNASAVSAETVATVAPLVNTDLIAGTLTTWPFGPKTVSAGSLADGSVSATSLADGAVVTEKIAAGAIGATEIAANAIIAGKIGANAVTATTVAAGAIEAGKIAANAITADKILAGAITAIKIDSEAITSAKIKITDTFKYTNTSGSEEVRIGQNAITDIPGTPGLSIVTDSVATGWIGGWGGGALEVGSNFSQNYMDFHTSSMIRVDNSSDGISFNGASCSLDVGFTSSNVITVTGAARFTSDSTAAFRILDSNSNIGISVSNKVGGTVGYFRFNLTAGGASRTGILTDSIISCASLVQTSSRRFKTDIESFAVAPSILDVPIVKFKYDYSKMDYGYGGLSDSMVGVIAEDLIDLGFRDVVIFDEENPELPNSVDYSKLAIMLIPVVKELKLEVEDLKMKVDAL